MIYKAFDKQIAFHKSNARIRAMFSGKRGGKTNAAAIEGIRFSENKINYKEDSNDEYLGCIIAPTNEMLVKLALKKFIDYGKPFITDYNKTFKIIKWRNGSMVYGVSGDKPERLEGLKLNWCWIDEILQCDEQLYLEALARLSDTKGYLWVTGSLGVQYNNPQNHWAYRAFKENPLPDTEVFEWSTAENPHFDPDGTELERMKSALDPRTFRLLFELDWNTPPTNIIYEDFDENNILDHYTYDPTLKTYVTVDWGWSHPLASLFIQLKDDNTVIVFDEIYGSKIKRETLWEKIKEKQYNITDYYCDIAGKHDKEWGSYVQWFSDSPRNIRFKYRSTPVSKGIALIRSFIKTSLGQRKLLISKKCRNTLDEIRNYSYSQRQGVILEEPRKEKDHAMDALRYFFVNKLDHKFNIPEIGIMPRWGSTSWQQI